ncbi:hypothetical protein KX729_28470 [Rhizobium sp. XQZ8]|uniref:hypothetical protein n=1 Tax=Rhizobium populisoli TaxID=2859785 RepID=UPI001CA53598|nr:hypothetical protein [Rhizobium populisoli]MBW6425368.1 hypothetical protein [Rhizobium populisoli]
MLEYRRYYEGLPKQGDIVVKFYHSGDQIRGYVRKVADTANEDTIFPGEEMEPDAAFAIAKSHGRGDDIWVELTEDVTWDEGWGRLVY